MRPVPAPTSRTVVVGPTERPMRATRGSRGVCDEIVA